MSIDQTDQIEQSKIILEREIEKLDSLNLSFAAALVRIAHLDLLMRLHNVTTEEIDLLSFATNAVDKERAKSATEAK